MFSYALFDLNLLNAFVEGKTDYRQRHKLITQDKNKYPVSYTHLTLPTIYSV